MTRDPFELLQTEVGVEVPNNVDIAAPIVTREKDEARASNSKHSLADIRYVQLMLSLAIMLCLEVTDETHRMLFGALDTDDALIAVALLQKASN